MRLPILFLTTLFSLSQAWLWNQDVEHIIIEDITSVTPDSRIIGGSPTSIEAFPYTVQVQLSNQLNCGGTLLTRRHVLSAAHCFVDSSTPVPVPSRYSIRLGTTQRGSGGTVRQVSTIIVHHAYNMRTQDADVAVLVMSATVTLGSRVAQATVPRQGQTLYDNTPLVHVGWGRIFPDSSVLPTTLQAVTVYKINWTTCAARYRNLPVHMGGPLYLTNNMMCAGILDIGGADACQGDSGGPLLYGNTVVGITSWGYSCGHPTYPGVNAEVSAFTNWIEDTVRRYNSSPALGSTNAVLLIGALLASLTLLNKDV